MNRVKVLAVPGQVNGLQCLERRAKLRVVSMRLTTAIKIRIRILYIRETILLKDVVEDKASLNEWNSP